MNEQQQPPLVVDCQWHDSQTALTKHLKLFYFPSDCTLELHDVQLRRLFLKRTHAPHTFHLSQLRSSNNQSSTINIHGRLLNVTGYADAYTRSWLTRQLQSALVAVPVNQISPVFGDIGRHNFYMQRMRIIRSNDVSMVMHEFQDEQSELNNTSQDTKYALVEVIRDDGVKYLRSLTQKYPSIQYALTQPEDQQKLDSLFNGATILPRTAKYDNTTLLIIKPHLLATEYNTDDHHHQMQTLASVLGDIQSYGFMIEDAQLVLMDRVHAAEFYEIYKTVVPEYHAMVDELVSGPSLVLELSGGPRAPQELLEQQGDLNPTVTSCRLLAGPHDPEVAKKLSPKSLRAKYGVDKICNAIHVTDLPEDGVLEVDYFFRILCQ